MNWNQSEIEGETVEALTSWDVLGMAVLKEASDEVISCLLEAGRIQIRKMHLGTPIHTAISTIKPSVVKFLLDAGADPNIPNNNSIYPLQTALAITISMKDERQAREYCPPSCCVKQEEKSSNCHF